MKYWICIFAVIVTACLRAEDGNLPFVWHYKEMCHMATGDERAAYEFSKLREIAPKSAEFVARFWMEKASNSAPETLNRIADVAMKRASEQAEALRQNDKVLAEKLKDHSLALFYITYYYDHEAQIKNMIRMHLNREMKLRSLPAGQRLDQMRQQNEQWDRDILNGALGSEK